MTLSIGQIVDVDGVSGRAPSRALNLLEAEASRRTVLRALAITSLSLGATVLSWQPKFLLPSASAGTETAPGGNEQGWTGTPNCHGVNYTAMSDTSGAYYGWNAACYNPEDRYISSLYCRTSGTGWHRYDVEYPASGVTVNYNLDNTRCWPGNSLNAWRWTVGATGNEFRCSDGWMFVTQGGSTNGYKTVCRWRTA